jgi:hypothetical protein
MEPASMINRAAGYRLAMAMSKDAAVRERLDAADRNETVDRQHLDGHVDDQLASSTIKLSANVSADVGQRLRELAHVQRFSESSIVDVALKLFFALGDDAELGGILVDLGATLRRKQSAKPHSNGNTARAEVAEIE